MISWRLLEKFKGELVEVKLFKKDEKGNKNYIGELGETTEKELQIKADELIKIDRKNIAQVKTVYID